MKILFFNWKDWYHPQSGGAELVTKNICEGLVQDGHTVTFVTAIYEGALAKEYRDGIQIIRVGGNRISHPIVALIYYLKNLKNDFDLILEEVNTAPYFVGFFRGKARHVYLYHQLAGEVWNYQLKQPFSFIGRYILEPAYTYIVSRVRSQVMTISESSKADLVRYGFKKELIDIYPMFVGLIRTTFQPKKNNGIFEVLFLSALREMKQPGDAIQAYLLFQKTLTELQKRQVSMSLAGSGELQSMLEEKYKDKVIFLGRVSDKVKLERMQSASVLVSTSIKEGWGLIVSEANNLGTPCIVYDVDGLRDSGAVGPNIVTKANPQAMADALAQLYIEFTQNNSSYAIRCTEVFESSLLLTKENSYTIFAEKINLKASPIS